MKRPALCVVLLLMTWGPSALAQSYKCILTNSCKAPDCEFITELKFRKALVRAHAKLLSKVVSSNKAEWEKLKVKLREDLSKRQEKYASECRGWKLQQDAYVGMFVDPNEASCQVGMKDANGKVRATDLDALKRARQTCSEIVEADYEWQKALAAQCERDTARPDTLFNRVLGTMEPNQVAVESLQSSLLRYLSSCVPDAKLARDLSAHGLAALVADGKAARNKSLANRAKTSGE